MRTALRMLTALLLLSACSRPREEEQKPAPSLAREPEVPAPAAVLSEPPVPAEEACLARIERVLLEPPLPGTPKLDAGRAELFANVKAEPVLFVRPPEPDPGASEVARAHASLLGRTRSPWGVLTRMLPEFTTNPELARQVLLREGYVFAEQSRLALAFYAHLSVHHLFSEPRIWIQRGEQTRFAKREKDRYVWEDGRDAGRPVRLLVFDRVGVTEPTPPVHRDLRSLRLRLNFERFKARHLGERLLVADLRYGTNWIPTLLRAEGARLELECEAVPERAAAELGMLRERGARRERALFALRKAMLTQIEEELRFDEPKDEIGQQDGHLRMAWEDAYRSGRSKYQFNEHDYRVFGRNGQPAPPQVCLDFLLDTLERASGTWWRPRGEPPERVLGGLSFDQGNRRTMRSTRRFIEFAREKTEWFDVRDPAPKERVEIGRIARLTRVLQQSADHYTAGDMVFIHGFTPWDQEERHYHSFFIYDSDPITGFPLALIGNAGRPLMWVLRTEANRTPERRIVSRVRPKLEWLETVIAPALDSEVLAPAPLVPDASGV